jgi:hypothetical protein
MPLTSLPLWMEFTWDRVPKYGWLSRTDGMGREFRWISALDLVGQEFYMPLQEFPGLFHSFSEVNPTEKEILRFVSQYGQLANIVAENRLDFLSEQIALVHESVALWNALKSQDSAFLETRVLWDDDGVRFRTEQGRIEMIAPANTDFITRFKVGDPIQPAWHYLLRIVNAELQGRVSPRLLICTEAKKDTRMNAFRLFLVPGSLIGAIWLQLAAAVDGKKEFRRCQGCEKWIGISPDHSRRNRKFCSDSCRTRWHRHLENVPS